MGDVFVGEDAVDGSWTGWSVARAVVVPGRGAAELAGCARFTAGVALPWSGAGGSCWDEDVYEAAAGATVVVCTIGLGLAASGWGCRSCSLELPKSECLVECECAAPCSRACGWG